MTKSLSGWDVLIGGACALASALPRVPYLTLIPLDTDYLTQAVYALSIQPGKFMPLVGNDPYAGALFSYIIAIGMAILGVATRTPFIVILVMGTLTVGLTYLLARVLGLGRPWAALAALFMAANPHHILVNSHVPGTAHAVPLFTTAFLIAFALAVKRQSGWWLVAAGALFGLAMQTNPIPILMAPGLAVWFLVQNKSSIGLRTRWPYLAVAAFLLAYSPVLIYNIQNSGLAFRWARTRDYLWEPAPSLSAFAGNLGRLLLQLCRQVSGVLQGLENLQTLLGLPILYSVWAGAGLVYSARRRIGLPASALASQLLLMPVWSSHYGMGMEVRLTAQLTPLIAIAMSALAAGVWAWMRARVAEPRTGAIVGGAIVASFVALCLWPLMSLFEYYSGQAAAGQTNAYYYDFIKEFQRRWRGETILMGDSSRLFNPAEYFLSIHRIPFKALPLAKLQEHLATGQETGSVFLALDDEDMPQLKLKADLTPWKWPAADLAHRKIGVGWYTIQDGGQVKPTFVLDANEPLPAAVRPAQVNLADQLNLVGYQLPSSATPGSELTIHTYWTAARPVPDALTGFIHLIGPDGRLAAQIDQEFGRGFYPTNDWKPGQIVKEKQVLALPADLPAGDYTVWAGAYPFPSLERLTVHSSSLPAQDQLVLLGAIHIGP